MVWPVLPRVVLRRAVGHPLAWVHLALALVLVPLMARASPTLDLEPAALIARLVTRWAALARLVGAVAGILLLSGLAPLRAWLPGRDRVAGEFAALFLLALAAALPLYLGGLLAGGAGIDLGAAVVLAPIAACAHLAALGTLLLRASLPPRLHALALFLLAWVLPATLPETPAAGLAPLLDPTATEGMISSFGLLSAVALRTFAVVGGLLLAAILAVRPADVPPPA